MSKQRSRGRILTTPGKEKIKQAIRAWEFQRETRCTQEKLRELTGLDPSTSAKILNGSGGADKSKIENLFRAFGLQLEEGDLQAASSMLETTEPQPNPNFVGREDAIADLNALIERGAKVIVIQARGGVGKTTLAKNYLQLRLNSFLEIPIAKETRDIASIESLIEEKLRQLGEEPGREFMVSLDRFKRKLQSEPIGILIDNLEPALDSEGRFIEAHRRYVELLTVLADPSVRSMTLITTRERLHEPSVTLHRYLLKSLDVDAWEQYFQIQNLTIDTPSLMALHNAYGGNAKAMEIISGVILEDFDGDVAACWEANQEDLFIERELEDLVTRQFERLKKLNLNAYNLLCRMGCYRYQDVPHVPLDGLLSLLWELPEGQQRRRVVNDLRDRSLVEVEAGEYWLHPVIRAEAIARLRELPSDWEQANRRAAQFWTQSVAEIHETSEAERALEAFYHYIQIQDYLQAAKVIVNKRQNFWGTNESLGRSFYKRGLLKPIREVISLVKDEIGDGYHRAKLYHTLGATYWLSDNISQALLYCNTARDIARACLSDQQCSNDLENAHLLKQIEVNALLTTGICKIGLGEHAEALQIHQQARERCAEFNDERYMRSIMFYIAYLNSCLQNLEEARAIADVLYEEFERLPDDHLPSWVTEYRLFYLGMTYKNLREIERASTLYRRVIQCAAKSYYGQAKAKALYGQAALDREQDNFQMALDRHRQSIDYLSRIGAKYDLAEAYYQLGLTYQAMNERQKSDENLQFAFRLFDEMEAPRQVEKVRRAMKEG